MNKTPEPQVGEMSIMDYTGHSRVTWDIGEPGEVATAREVFDSLIAKGYSAFGSKEKAAPKHKLGTFDPTMEELIMVPRTVGG